MSTFGGNATTYYAAQEAKKCICLRSRKTIKCNRCNHLYEGRISEVCPKHPNVVYLMDIHNCSYCMAPLTYLEVASPELQQVKKYEDTCIPDDFGGDW